MTVSMCGGTDDDASLRCAELAPLQIVVGGADDCAGTGYGIDGRGVLVDRVVFVDGAFGIGITSLHDVFYERVCIDLQISIPTLFGVQCIEVAVTLVVGVQTIGRLPVIGDAIAVRVEICRMACGFQSIFTLVFNEVDNSREMGNGLSVTGFCG